jgi:homoserine kinase
VVVTPPRPVPAPRPVVVVERHPDNVATAAVVGGIIGGVIGAIVR